MNLEDELGKLKDTDIALVVAETEEYQAINHQLLQYLVNDKALAGVYVTVNKPYLTISDALDEAGISTERIFFIDAISEDVGADNIEGEDVVFLDSPEGLTDISIAISEAVDRLPEERKFLFLDSLTTLTIYNNVETVSEFIHHLTGKMRSWNVSGVILSLEAESDEELISQISQFCDVTIRSEKES